MTKLVLLLQLEEANELLSEEEVWYVLSEMAQVSFGASPSVQHCTDNQLQWMSCCLLCVPVTVYVNEPALSVELDLLEHVHETEQSRRLSKHCSLQSCSVLHNRSVCCRKLMTSVPSALYMSFTA